MQNLIYDTQNPKEIEDQKEERDNYIREREKYIAFFCKNYYNCKGDKNGKN